MARAVLFDRIGGPEVLRIEDRPVPEPGPGEVRIRVDAIGLNRAEALFRAGTYYEQTILPGSPIGYEAAGVVETGVEGFPEGTEISTIASFSMRQYGVYGDRVVVPVSSLVRRAVDEVTGASVWLTHQTAYGALVERGGLRPGDTVLITAASSGVGIAAIQIANHLGAVPIAVTRTGAKRDQLLAAGAAHVVTLDSTDLVKEVRELTGGAGATLTIDPVGGPGVVDLVEATAVGGLLVVYGWMGGAPTPLPMNWDRQVTVFGYGNGSYVTRNPERRRRSEHFINAGLRIGTLRPAVDRVFDDLADIVEAHAHLESNAQVGKVVVRVRH
ncbi:MULTISPECIES: zinc-dependent alcohol dehydrogenase family protein [Amycolatopsis]|uniref:zinc-dependent alcohol dehydrogenase family protein n=1 Tax=Amycolatopsis TaxID=1813 RepID=UPI000B8AB00E|nr:MULTISPECIES: zinc-dependent alcohol dehydrogenase family protein [Amycolatopsis]OXM68945.1 NADPH:quinone reductase [Amycolatopsis sp. KNN50.9b]